MNLEDLIRGRNDLSPATKRSYVAAIRRFVVYVGSDPRAWTPDAALRWTAHIVASTDPKLKPQSVNTMINALRTASREWSMYNSNRPEFDFARVVRQIKKVDPPKKKAALSYEAAQAMIDACRGTNPMDLRDQAMTVLGFKTGMRRMSLAALEFEGIDWSAHVIEITLKGGKRHRMPPLDEDTFEALEPWRAWLRSRGVRSGRFFRGFYGLPSLGTDGGIRESITVDGIHKVLVKRAESAGLEDFSPHTFRHTFVTWMQQLERPGYLIRAYTGHSSDAMVLEYTDAWIAARKQPPMADFLLRRA
jgi:integrase